MLQIRPPLLAVQPRLAYTDYTPNGPWNDGDLVTRNADGVLFTYSATLNALTVNPNQSGSTKDANNFPIINLPDPTNNLDAANKEYVDTHGGGGGGGITDAPSDSTLYGRENGAWVHAVPLAGGTMTGILTLSGGPSGSLDAANKGYVDTAVSGVAVPPASTTTPVMDGTGAAGTATAYSRGDHVHPTDTSRAPLASPVFTGDPQAPTPATADNDTSVATTAFVKAQGYAPSGSVPVPSSTTPIMDGTGAAGSATAYARGDHVHPSDTTKASLASPIFTGTPAAPTAAALTNTTQLATTAYADSAVLVEKNRATAAEVLLAPLASPTFTGTPLSTTPATADNTTKIATTAYVQSQGYATSGSLPPPSTSTPVMDGTGAAGSATAYARGDHVHPSDTSRAPLASPTFTGTPAAPTPAANDNTTKIATTAFVAGQAGAANPLMDGTVAVGTSLLYARQDHIHPSDTTKIGDAPNDGNLYARKNLAWSSFSPTGSGAPLDALMHNNMIINGAMEVSQENGSTLLTLSSGSTRYIVDQWYGSYVSSAAVVKCQQATGTYPVGPNAFMMQATTAFASSPAAGDIANFGQTIEGYRWQKTNSGSSAFGSLSVTIGFWITATVAGTFAVGIRNAAGTRSYVTDVVYTTAGAWQWCTVTIPVDTAGTWVTGNVGAALLNFCFNAGSTFRATVNTWAAGNFLGTSSTTNFFATANNAVYITGVVAVVGTSLPAPGSIASYSLTRPFDEEFRLCQRYLEYGNEPMLFLGGGLTPAAGYGSMQYIVPKRAGPTITPTSWQYWTGSGGASFTPTFTAQASQFQWSPTGMTNWNGWVGNGTWKADCRM